MNFRTVVSMAMLAMALALPAEAGCKVDISSYADWKIVYSGTVTGYIDEKNGEIRRAFRGCRRGRILIVDNRKTVTCTQYNYSYAYRPDIVVMSKGFRLKACIDDELYDVRTRPSG